VVLFGGVIVVAVALLVVRHVHPPTVHARAVPPKPVHFAVGIARCTFVDPTRSTKNYGTGAITAGRVLVTEVRYPTLSGTPGLVESPGAHPALRHGPFPLVIFAHGYDLTPDTYAALLDTWTRAGYVVAAPLFPDTNQASVDALGKVFAPEADDVNQPGDVAFVMRSVLADAATQSATCGILHGLVARSGAVLAGQSDGAVTVDALAYGAAYLEPGLAIRGVISLSGGEYPAPNGAPTPYASRDGGPPLLVTQSATDECNPPQNSTTLYSAVSQLARWFLTIDDANHLPPYTDALPAQHRAFVAVAAVTTTFIEDIFDHVTPGKRFLKLGNAHPGVARLTTGAAPVLPTLELVPSTCYVN
jgi:hypothetical protein